MANVCNNWVEIEGDEEEVERFAALVGKEFSFEEVIPTKDDSKAEGDKKWGCCSPAFDADMDHTEGSSSAAWYFWTKWGPATLVYQKLRELFPDLFIYWRYEERGEGLYGYLNNEDSCEKR